MADARTRQKRRRMLHLVLTVFFTLHMPVAAFMFFFERRTWQEISVFYLVLVSQWALVAAHWGAFEAAHPPIQEDDAP